MFKLTAGRFSSHLLLHDALLTGQKSCGSRRKHVLQKSQWQAQSSWFQSQPSLSITTQTWSTPHMLHKEQPRSWALQGCVECHTLQISLQDIVSCGLWCLRKRKPLPESLRVITVTVASVFKSRKKCRRSLLSTPVGLSTHRSCYRNSNLPRHIIFQQRFTSLLTESVYNHTRLLLLCVSLLKVGQPGDSTPPMWYRREAELALNHTELLV